MIEGTVATQFETIAAAAKGCNIIVGATALQVAAPSVAAALAGAEDRRNDGPLRFLRGSCSKRV